MNLGIALGMDNFVNHSSFSFLILGALILLGFIVSSNYILRLGSSYRDEFYNLPWIRNTLCCAITPADYGELCKLCCCCLVSSSLKFSLKKGPSVGRSTRCC